MPADSERRQLRHREILRLLRHRRVRGQGEIVALLRARGFEATQSSVSRDLRDLGVAKVVGRYMAPEAPHTPPPAKLLEAAPFLRGARPAGPYLTVVLTVVGAAQQVALALDRARWPEVVGTVAGDDTIFIATAGARDQKRCLAHLTALLQGAES